MLEEKRGVVAKLDYVQEQIDHLQRAIVDVDSAQKVGTPCAYCAHCILVRVFFCDIIKALGLSKDAQV